MDGRTERTLFIHARIMLPRAGLGRLSIASYTLTWREFAMARQYSSATDVHIQYLRYYYLVINHGNTESMSKTVLWVSQRLSSAAVAYPLPVLTFPIFICSSLTVGIRDIHCLGRCHRFLVA